MNKKIKNKIKSSLLLLTLLFTCSITVFANGVGDTGNTGQGNNQGGDNVYTFHYFYNAQQNAINLKVTLTTPIYSFGNSSEHTWSSPTDSVILKCSNPVLDSNATLDQAINAAIANNNSSFTLNGIKGELNARNYYDKGNGIWCIHDACENRTKSCENDGYLTYFNFNELKKNHFIHYDLNGGKWPPPRCNYGVLQSLQLKEVGKTAYLYPEIPERAGFTFQYWIHPFGGFPMGAGAPYPFDNQGEGVTLTAHWEDETKPDVKITATPNQWSNQSANITISVNDISGSGVRRTELYRVEAGQPDVFLWAWDLPPFNQETTQGTVDYFYTDNVEGLYQYKAVVYDWKGNGFSREHKNSLGNVNAAVSEAVLIDKTAPTATITATPENAWTNNKGVLSIDFNDHSFANVKSGIKEVHWYRRECFNNGNWSGWVDLNQLYNCKWICNEPTKLLSNTIPYDEYNNGVYQYRAIIEDHAGNKTTIDSKNVHIDKVGPTISINENKLSSVDLTKPLNPSSFHTGDYGLTLNVTANDTNGKHIVSNVQKMWLVLESGNVKRTYDLNGPSEILSYSFETKGAP